MHFHRLTEETLDYRCVGVTGLRLKNHLKIDKVLSDLQSASATHNTPTQVIDANYLCGPRHAYHAASLALKAHNEKRARAKKVEMELLLYLSGSRQIGEAIDSMGLQEGTRKLAVIAIGSTEDSVRGALTRAGKLFDGEYDDAILEVDRSKKKKLEKVLQITKSELGVMTENRQWQEALLKLVLERGAMLDALKK